MRKVILHKSGDEMIAFPGKGKVAVLETIPDTIVDDNDHLMKLAEFHSVLPKENSTGFKKPSLYLLECNQKHCTGSSRIFWL
jgi:hypothetical protein